MSYLRNCWYVAAAPGELGPEPLGRTILGEPLVLYRTEGGEAVALGDRCPHRFAPLHRGKVRGDLIQCPYHGLEFGPTGLCAHNPQGKGAIPAGARVSSYPVTERWGYLWIWMGLADADATLIPDLAMFADQPDHKPIRGYMRPRANYELLTDNLMDLSHARYLHSGGIGSDALDQSQNDILAHGSRIRCTMWMPGTMPSPYYASRLDYAGMVDHWLDMEWTPPAMLTLDSGVTRVGRPRNEGVSGYVAHLLTPETATTTHYFWAHARNDRRGDLQVSEQIARALRNAFENEDLPMIEAQQTLMNTPDLWSLHPVLLPADAAAVRVRRALAKLIREEQSAPKSDTVGRV